ncbi:response regulator [Arcobacter roscoffensis]|uniref:Response regulator n=1 Tax=Arcobacter roscoffensis TaxID=2961520 RepID=A0ABY5E654_9BACT|nr:response regulator [Arcobacter roscoffensis]UTJ07649.1 response regulator [Arcobacter roscoffensis]
MFNYAFLKKLDILYIESNEKDNSYLTEMLCKQFRNVISEKNGKDGLDKFKKNKDEEFELDIVIVSEKLDDMSGLDVLKGIRELNSNIPVIITTNKIEIEPLLEAIDYQATDYLQKPINAKDLVFSVENICQNKYHAKLRIQAQKDLEDIIEVINEVALVIKTNEHGEITFVNSFFSETSNYSLDELVGSNYEILKDEGTNKLIFEDLWHKVKQGEIWEGKLRFITKNKDFFYVYLTVVPVMDKKNSNIKEYMWVSFLATQDELEQKEFKKKAAQNIQANRRINTQAREKIDELINKLSFYRNIETQIRSEKERNAKFSNQIIFYKKELEQLEKKLKETSEKASVKIKKVVADEKVTREKKDKVVNELRGLTKELDIKNKTIKELTSELDLQVKTIEKLMASIERKENQIGI